REGKVVNIDKENLTMKVQYQDGEVMKDYTDKFWKFDKLKYTRKEELVSNRKTEVKPTLFFAKVKENARIPKKVRKAEAGFDVWSCLEPREVGEGVKTKKVYELL